METKSLSAGKIVLFVLLGLLIILVLWGMSAYNSLVRLDENAKTAQSDIEVQYQRRFDLIPNLVNVVEGISQQEREVFGKLAEARSRYAGSPEGSSERLAAIGQLETSLSRLLVIVENYPQLKSSENFLRLQDQLEGTENRVSVARNNFNAAVNQLNQKIKFFPSNLVAGIFGFEARERFEAVEAAAEAPKVEIDFQ